MGRRRRRRARSLSRLFRGHRFVVRRGASLPLLACVVLYLVLLNGLVRARGGNPSLLSPTYVPEKTTAALKLARHYLGHPLQPCPSGLLTLLDSAARRHRLPSAFVRSVARAESGFDPHAISATGAMGLMQLMPATAREQGVEDPFDPAQSADGGARYLRRLWLRYGGDRRRVAAAYNMGPGRVPRTGRVPMPAETRAYVARVTGL